jgi:hypothetical protein
VLHHDYGTVTSAFAAGATPYLSRDFRTVREEVFWFEWE